jgi:hypothetical protein
MRENILFLSLLFLFLILIAESMLRIFGYHPWMPVYIEDEVIYKPYSPFYQDTLLGYRMHKGNFYITYNNEFTFFITINDHGYRITKLDSINFRNKKKICFLGDSFTLGSGLNDNETYPYIIQDSLFGYNVMNYAIPGYGVANIFNQIMYEVPPDSGDILIYAYFNQHNNRYERKVLKMLYAQPKLMGSMGYIVFSNDKEGRLIAEFQPYNYKMYLLSPYSSIINLLEDGKNILLDRSANLKSQSFAFEAIKRIDIACRKRGATFILAGIQRGDGTEKMLDFCKSNDILNVDIAVDLNDNTYNQMPYDNHPNAFSNKIFAQRIMDFLKKKRLIDI